MGPLGNESKHPENFITPPASSRTIFKNLLWSQCPAQAKYTLPSDESDSWRARCRSSVFSAFCAVFHPKKDYKNEMLVVPRSSSSYSSWLMILPKVVFMSTVMRVSTGGASGRKTTVNINNMNLKVAELTVDSSNQNVQAVPVRNKMQLKLFLEFISLQLWKDLHWLFNRSILGVTSAAVKGTIHNPNMPPQAMELVDVDIHSLKASTVGRTALDRRTKFAYQNKDFSTGASKIRHRNIERLFS